MGGLVCPDCTRGLKRGIGGGYVACSVCRGTGRVPDPRQTIRPDARPVTKKNMERFRG